LGEPTHIGESYDDVRKDWEANTTRIGRIFKNPKIDASGWPGEIGVDDGSNLKLTSQWSNSDSFVGKFSYNVANGYYLASQVVDFDLLGKDYENPLTGQRAYTNLNGTPQYDSGERVLEFVTSAIPYLAYTDSTILLKIMPKKFTKDFLLYFYFDYG
jgi:hypothetical protein